VTLADFAYPVLALWFSCSKLLLNFWLSNSLALSVPDEGYFRNASSALILVSTFLIFLFHAVSFYHIYSAYIIYFFLCSVSLSLFAFLSFSIWPLYCLPYKFQLLMTSMVSLNFSFFSFFLRCP